MKIYTINELGLEHIRLQLVDKLAEGRMKEWFEEEHLRDSASTKDMLSAWASDLEDDLNECQDDDWGEVELSQHLSQSGHTEFISVEEGHFDILKLEWQVTYDTENTPAFGLDVFDQEEEAFEHAWSLAFGGKENVVVTLFENDSPTDCEDVCVNTDTKETLYAIVQEGICIWGLGPTIPECIANANESLDSDQQITGFEAHDHRGNEDGRLTDRTGNRRYKVVSGDMFITDDPEIINSYL